MNILWGRITKFVSGLWSEWDRFWFQPADGLSLSVLRVFAGAMILYTHFVWGFGLTEFFGRDGFQDSLLVETFQEAKTAISFWWYVPAGWEWTAHYISLGILLCFLLGIATRVTSVLAAFIAISYANRVPLATFGLDQINVFLAIYLAIGRCGDYLSVDALFRRYFRAKDALVRGLSHCDLTPSPAASTQLATRLVQMNLSILYLFAGLSKLKGDTWWDGTAIWWGAANLEYQSGDLTWLAWYPWIGNLVTHTTVIWEVSFIFAIWNLRLRPWILSIGVLLHFGIGAFMGMWTFGLVMMIAYISFLPPEWLQNGLAFLKRLVDVKVPVIEYSPAYSSVTGSAARAALSFADAVEFRPLPPLVSSDRPSTEIPSPIEWSRQVLSNQTARWPFQPIQNGAPSQPPQVLVISSLIQEQIELQRELSRNDENCRVATDIPLACVALAHQPASAVVLMLHHLSEIDMFAQFRERCIAGGDEAPVTLAIINKSLLNSVPWQPQKIHRLMSTPCSFNEIEDELHLAWSHRCSPHELKGSGKNGQSTSFTGGGSSPSIRPTSS